MVGLNLRGLPALLLLCCAGQPLQAERAPPPSHDRHTLSPAAEARPTRARILVQSSLAAGLRHHDAKAVWVHMRVGDTLALVREPDNPNDANAVRLEWQGRMLGYLPREDNADVARQLDRGAGLQARIAELARYRNHRLKLGVEIYRDL